jgi:ankyrin repeat protein
MQKDFIRAAKSGDTAKVMELLNSDPTLLGVLDTDGSTALHCAAWKGHFEIVRALLDAGASVHVHNKNDHWGTTPLHAAAHANQPAIAELLIQNGADINATDLEGRTPLAHTTFHNARAVAKVLERHAKTT